MVHYKRVVKPTPFPEMITGIINNRANTNILEQIKVNLMSICLF